MTPIRNDNARGQAGEVGQGGIESDRPSNHTVKRRSRKTFEASVRYEHLKGDFREAGLTPREYERQCRLAARRAGL